MGYPPRENNEDGTINSFNDRLCLVNRLEAAKRGGSIQHEFCRHFGVKQGFSRGRAANLCAGLLRSFYRSLKALLVALRQVKAIHPFTGLLGRSLPASRKNRACFW